MLPPSFRSRRALRVANSLAVASALAASTGVAFAHLLGHSGSNGAFAGVSTLSTFAVGLAWTALLRMRQRITRWQIQIGWVLSPALAAMNAALAAGVLFGIDGYGGLFDRLARFLMGALAGVTVGAMFWMPALVVTLMCFGFPIARAQRLADRGLSGEEQGERVVGISAVVLGLLSALPMELRLYPNSPVRWLLAALSLTAMAAGASAALLATARAKRRRTFVADAEAGRVPGYRVMLAPEGKVLVRVETRGEVYRGSEHFEALVELDHDGEATRALVP
jgi:hypothetical protein